MRSPFWAKHHVVVQYMARWLKCSLGPCPLPSPTPTPNPPAPKPPCPPTPPMEDKEDKEESATLLARDFALQLP